MADSITKRAYDKYAQKHSVFGLWYFEDLDVVAVYRGEYHPFLDKYPRYLVGSIDRGGVSYTLYQINKCAKVK